MVWEYKIICNFFGLSILNFFPESSSTGTDTFYYFFILRNYCSKLLLFNFLPFRSVSRSKRSSVLSVHIITHADPKCPKHCWSVKKKLLGSKERYYFILLLSRLCFFVCWVCICEQTDLTIPCVFLSRAGWWSTLPTTTASLTGSCVTWACWTPGTPSPRAASSSRGPALRSSSPSPAPTAMWPWSWLAVPPSGAETPGIT